MYMYMYMYNGDDDYDDDDDQYPNFLVSAWCKKVPGMYQLVHKQMQYWWL